MKKVIRIAFLVIGFLTVLEFSFMCGTFTGPTMLVLSLVSGLACIALEIKEKNFMQVLLYLVSTAALSMGYMTLMF